MLHVVLLGLVAALLRPPGSPAGSDQLVLPTPARDGFSDRGVLDPRPTLLDGTILKLLSTQPLGTQSAPLTTTPFGRGHPLLYNDSVTYSQRPLALVDSLPLLGRHHPEVAADPPLRRQFLTELAIWAALDEVWG